MPIRKAQPGMRNAEFGSRNPASGRVHPSSFRTPQSPFRTPTMTQIESARALLVETTSPDWLCYLQQYHTV